MIVLCRHGHFAFYPDALSDVTRLARNFGVTLVPDNDFFTFEALANAPRWSLPLQPWQGVPAAVAFEGRDAWEVMRENGLVFSIPLQAVVLKDTIISTVAIYSTQNWFTTAGNLLQPGSRNTTGQQILSYHGRLNLDSGTFRLTSYSYE